MKGKVKLVFDGKSKYFPFEMAQGLLYIRTEMNRTSVIKKPGWKLPDDSPYEFKNNGLIKRPNKKDSGGPATPKRDTKRSTASGETEIS